MTPTVSPQRRLEILDALRRGTVPSAGLDVLAVGLDPYLQALDETSPGRCRLRCLQGDTWRVRLSKTFILDSSLSEQAQGLATAEVQISEADTPPIATRPSTADW